MNEQLLHDLRGEPSPELTRRLRDRLHALPPPRIGHARHWATRPALAAVTVVVAVTVLFMVPGVRASAQAFLDLFRVTNFVPVRLSDVRAQQLRTLALDPPHLIGDVTVVQDAGPPLAVNNLAAAAGLAGLDVRVPRQLPADVAQGAVRVVGARALKVTVSTNRLQQVVNALALRDVMVPDHLDGQIVTVRVPPVVQVRYEGELRSATLFQSRAPTVELPGSLNLEALGELSLRILGVERREARRLADAIDWHSTLLVPVPPDSASIRRVRIGGVNGLAIESEPRPGRSPRPERDGLIIWSTVDHVFALQGSLAMTTLLEMANAIP